MEMLVVSLLLVAVALPFEAGAISPHFAHRFGGKIDDLQGPYCEGRTWGSTGSRWWAGGRSSVCCNGRLDDCSVPILGTLCYCDQFCDRGVTHDCCPDYWDVCTDTPPPPAPTGRCIHNGRTFNVGQKLTDNCNTCECIGSFNAAPTASCTRHKCLLDSSLSNALRREPNLGWQAVDIPAGATKANSAYSEFWGRTLDEGLELRLGTLDPDSSLLGMQNSIFRINGSLPDSFDWRTREKNLMPPLDQGWCASSWALSAATVISDRAMVEPENLNLLVQPLIYEHLLECPRGRPQRERCSKGYLHRVWKFLNEYGAPEKDCVDRRGPDEGMCIPRPRSVCRRYMSGPAYKLGSVESIQDNIRLYGPVQATMRVYQDFFHYRGGVYSRPDGSDRGQPHGYHSVRIVGWGVDRTNSRYPIPYWLVANSWGTWWGEDGYFRIRRGVNECDIEKYVLSAWIQPELYEPLSSYRSRSSRRG